MFILFKKLFSNDSNSVPDIFSSKYEEYLLKQYGNADEINNSITLLVIADTHGTLDEDEFKQYLEHKQYDICIMLGDHYNRDIDIILRYVDKSKIYGIKGNHDYDYLSDYDIHNINGNIIEINGVKILGMEGSFKYKPVDFPSFTQEESITFLENKPKVDILVTHDKKFDYEKYKQEVEEFLPEEYWSLEANLKQVVVHRFAVMYCQHYVTGKCHTFKRCVFACGNKIPWVYCPHFVSVYHSKVSLLANFNSGWQSENLSWIYGHNFNQFFKADMAGIYHICVDGCKAGFQTDNTHIGFFQTFCLFFH